MRWLHSFYRTSHGIWQRDGCPAYLGLEGLTICRSSFGSQHVCPCLITLAPHLSGSIRSLDAAPVEAARGYFKPLHQIDLQERLSEREESEVQNKAARLTDIEREDCTTGRTITMRLRTFILQL